MYTLSQKTSLATRPTEMITAMKRIGADTQYKTHRQATKARSIIIPAPLVSKLAG
jgi:hypothetical protein